MARINNRKVLSGLLWRFAERCGAQGASFIVSIILARLLNPDIYGTISLITVFTTILQVFIDSGMANALIQKKDADEIDFSTVLFFNISVCCILYLGMYIAAPLIAEFYNNKELTVVIRVLSLILIISGIKNVQQAYVSRNMLFKRFFYATLGGTLSAAIVSIIMAYNGFGVWALVIQYIFNAFVDTVILWITVKWRPQRTFSFQRLKDLFSYGWKLLVSGLLDTTYNNARQLIIGKIYSSADLAYYNRGRQFPNFIRFRYPCRLIRSVRQHRLKLLCRLFAHGTFRQFGKRLSLRLLIIHIPAHTAFKYHCHTLLLCIFRFLLPTFRTKIEHLKIIIQNLPAKLCRQRSRQIFEHHVRQSAALSAHQMIMTPFPVITIR